MTNIIPKLCYGKNYFCEMSAPYQTMRYRTEVFQKRTRRAPLLNTVRMRIRLRARIPARSFDRNGAVTSYRITSILSPWRKLRGFLFYSLFIICSAFSFGFISPNAFTMIPSKVLLLFPILRSTAWFLFLLLLSRSFFMFYRISCVGKLS